MSDDTSPAAANGHDASGRFAPGNKLGCGNPHASKVQKLRAAMLRAIGETDIEVVISKLIDLARSGDIKAATLLFSVVGKPVDADNIKAQPPSAEQRGEMIQRIAERVRSERAEASDQPAA